MVAAYTLILNFLAFKIAVEREFAKYKPTVQRIVYEYPYSKGKTLNKISAELKVDPETIGEFNQWLTAKNVPDTDCNVLVVVPVSRYNEIRSLAELAKRANLPTKDLGFPVLVKLEKPKKEKDDKNALLFQINGLSGIQAELCDNPITLAYKAAISVEKFIEYNDIRANDFLNIGQVYYTERKNTKANVPFHVTRDGETLWNIAQIYGVRLQSLLEYNRFETVQRLQKGRVIWLQSVRPKDKAVEVINLPDELEEIEEMIDNEAIKIEPIIAKHEKITETNEAKNTPIIAETNTVEKQIPLVENTIKEPILSTITESDLSKRSTNSLSLGQEIRKNENKPIDLSSDNSMISSAETSINQQVITTNTIPEETKVIIPETKEFGNFVKYVVKKGDTLFKIAINYNVPLDNLWKWNALTSAIVENGKVLNVRKL